MSSPLIVSLPHRLGKDEVLRRLRSGLCDVRTNYTPVLAIKEEKWSGDQLRFRVRSFGQEADGIIEVSEDHLRLELNLPWVLETWAHTVATRIRKEGLALIAKK
jgi:hypothetical protein